MSKKSIFYKHPLLYILGLKWLHKSNFTKRYRYMASFVQKGDLVLEPACGPAILADFLPEGVYYQGFDMNKEFIDYASKKHSGVYLGNVLDPKNYCQADIVVACDILHHLKPRDRKTFIKHCFEAAKKKLIICEPGKKDYSQKGVLSSLKKRLVEWSEKDGTCDFRIEYFLTKEELLNQIKTGFGIIPTSIQRSIKEFGEDIVVVYFKEIYEKN